MTKLELPQQTRSKLLEFRRRLWTVKLTEGISAAVFGLILSYLFVFIFDRFFETSAIVRGAILITGSLGLAVWFPWVCHRWIWRSRRLEQVARMLKITQPRLGDYLLGIVELVKTQDFQGTSESLCRAALAQADRETRNKDLSDAVPYPRHRRWIGTASLPIAIALVALLVVPAAGWNALQRWLLPWRAIDRYTFTVLDPLPDHLVVPAAEPVDFSATIATTSRWNPDRGTVWLGNHKIESEAKSGAFQFRLPPLSSASQAEVRIGDVLHSIQLDPQPRPELSELTASIEFPEYLQRKEPLQRPLRGGGLSTVAGSRVTLTALATRDLQQARVNGSEVNVQGASLTVPPVSIVDSQTLELEWHDSLGLSAKTPLQVKLRSVDDQAPSITCRDLEQQRVLMERDVLTFTIDAADDFGVRRVGMQWQGKPAPGSPSAAAQGEKIVMAGDPYAAELTQIACTLSPASEGIEPQAIQLRLFVEDYLPDREPIFSPNYTVFVLSEDEHAIWMTRRLDEWFKQALEVYEREQQLYQRNKELRDLSTSDLDRPETRRRIEAQATAESAQARQLDALTQRGEKLVQEAARNENFGVDHLEKLADMMQQLKDIHENRMPSVSDLLKQAASAAVTSMEKANKPTDSESPRTSVSDIQNNPGQKSAARGGANQKQDDASEAKPVVPSVSIKESSMNSGENSPQESKPPGQSNASSPPLRLPSVSLDPLPDKEPRGEPSSPAENQMQAAVAAQESLLAEFQKVAEELQKLISNLEGSTFVKRLKALSRYELVLANDVSRTSLSGFGSEAVEVAESTRARTELLAERQRAYITTIENILEDLSAYLTRNPDGKFQTVYEEMQEVRIAQQVGLVADRLVSNETGTSVAHAEWLADTLDRWGEQLVGPGCKGGKCPGGPKGSLPPSLVLEVMKILAAEIDLREQTRETEQARPQLQESNLTERVSNLNAIQKALVERTDAVIEAILDLPDGESEFAREIQQLSQASAAMSDAESLLAKSETGKPTLAAETEAIEWLLQARRPGNGSGGGGSNPGDGKRSEADFATSALAQLGSSAEKNGATVQRESLQASGKSGRELPDEFRDGLDRYFESLEE